MPCDRAAVLVAGQALSHRGRPVFAIVSGMIVTLFIRDRSTLQSGITFVSKKVLQYAVILLGFGMNLSVILQTGKQSLPIILVTITTSLVIAWALHKLLHIPGKISTLIGVGSSICGGSAIAATAPVIDADDEEVAQAISVIFFFNMLAALLFPMLGTALGFSQTSGEAFGIFAGTAVNDTSSVTAAASTWDSMYSLGSETLDKAVTVKLTRTLAIIPITLVLAWMRTRSAQADGKKVELKKIFPFFILYFILASVNHNRRDGGSAFRRGLLPAQDAQQVPHRPRDERHRPEHEHRQTHQNRRQAARSGLLLLGRHRGHEPSDAAHSGALVSDGTEDRRTYLFERMPWGRPSGGRSSLYREPDGDPAV